MLKDFFPIFGNQKNNGFWEQVDCERKSKIGSPKYNTLPGGSQHGPKKKEAGSHWGGGVPDDHDQMTPRRKKCWDDSRTVNLTNRQKKTQYKR